MAVNPRELLRRIEADWAKGPQAPAGITPGSLDLPAKGPVSGMTHPLIGVSDPTEASRPPPPVSVPKQNVAESDAPKPAVVVSTSSEVRRQAVSAQPGQAGRLEDRRKSPGPAAGTKRKVSAALGALAPLSKPFSDPSRTLTPVVEFCVFLFALACLATSLVALARFPVISAAAAGWHLHVTVGTAVAVVGLIVLTLRRWRLGLAALRAVEESANRKGITDPLTGLANRAGYRLHLDERLKALPPGRPLGIVYIDLDRFKEVNDNYGHEMGDKLLCAVTERLAEMSDGRAVGARLGGDEFALLVHGCDTADEIVAMAESASRCLGTPFTIDSVELVIGGSVGIAVAPEDGEEPSELVRRADISMYRAKAAGRGQARRFDTSMEDGVRKKKVMEDELRHAIERGELRMVFQPFFASDGETIRGVEALVRWENDKLGTVSPAEFIALAEETGLIGEIGEWTVRESLAQAAAWPDISIAVNVSPAQFRAKGLAARMIEMVAQSGIEAKRIEIEVTEGVLIRDADRAAQTISELRAAGMRVALDDFGTGFASLSYLRRFQFDKLKIDQVFVKTLSSERNSGSAAIIHNVVALGRSLGMTVQAEGVETLEHHIFLRAAGCHCLQGYYFAKPMGRDEFDSFFRTKRGLLAASA